MKKLFGGFLLLLASWACAQDINDVGAANVNRMKEQGLLTGSEQYTNRLAQQNIARVSAPPTNTTSSANNCECWIQRDTSFHIVPFDGSGGSGGPGVPPDYRNDDWSTSPITLPFNFCFYGQSVNQIYINNNGNVSIGGAYSTFTALSFPNGTYTMVAPFWGDVDTRGTNSGLVYYSLTPTHLIVQWENVGYYNTHDDKVNTFQLVITNGLDPIINGGQNVSFCYKDMQWTTGDASSGTNGFGGSPATVGINQGNGTDYIQFGLFDTSGGAYDGAYGLNDGVDWLDNREFNINACVSNANIPPVLSSQHTSCDTIVICEGTSLSLNIEFLAPEQSQTTTISYFAPGVTGLNLISNTPGNTATLVLEFQGLASNIGTNTFTVTAIDNGTPPAATNIVYVIEVLPAPHPSFTYSPASPVQVNTPVSFTNTSPPGILLTWDFGDGTTSTTPNPTHTYTAPGVYTVTLTGAFPNGCTGSASQQIVVTQCSPAALSINNTCVGAPASISYVGTATPLANYVWDFDGGQILSGTAGGPYAISWNTAGTYNISLTVTEGQCSSSVSMPVTVVPGPISALTAPLAFCSGTVQTINFSGTASAGATYIWDFGSGVVQTGTGGGPYDVLFSTPGSEQVQVVVSEGSCSDTATLALTVDPLPTANFQLQPSACAQENVTITYSGTASPTATYNWNFGTANVTSGSGQGPYDLNWGGSGTNPVTLIVIENGCSSPQEVMNIQINASPIVSFTPVTAVCEGQAATINFGGTTGPTAVFNWDFGTGTVLSGSGSGPYSVVWNSAGNYPVELTIDENNCVGTGSQSVAVNEIPTSDFVVLNSACAGAPVTLNYTGTATPAANFDWQFSGGTIVSGSGAGPYDIVWNTSGAYAISLSVTENGCLSPVTNLNATVNPSPTVSAGLDQTLCSGDATSIGQPAIAGETYSWSPSNFLSNPSASDPVITPTNSQGQTAALNYTITVTDINGCTGTDAVTVSVNPEPFVSFDRPPAQCLEGNEFLFTAKSNLGTGMNYSWTFTPQAQPNSTVLEAVSASYNAVGTFAVRLSGDYSGCQAQPYVDSVTVLAMPVADFIPLNTQGCVPLTVNFRSLSSGNLGSYSWNFGDGFTGSDQDPVHEFTKPGLYSVSLGITSAEGCPDDTALLNIIEVYAAPEGNFTPNPSVANILNPIIQFKNHSTNVNYLTWNFGDSTLSHDWEPEHRYADTGSYEIVLMLISDKGCLDTVRGLVRVERDFSFYIPNAFTPNGDGVNDSFRGYGVSFNEFQMNIYNRWGEVIFKTSNYDEAWDGRVNSNMAQSDVYVYRIVVIDHHNKEHTYIGNVSLVR